MDLIHCGALHEPEAKTADGRTYHAPELVRAVCMMHNETRKGWRTIARHFRLPASTVRDWLRGTRRLTYVRRRNQHDDGLNQ